MRNNIQLYNRRNVDEGEKVNGYLKVTFKEWSKLLPLKVIFFQP